MKSFMRLLVEMQNPESSGFVPIDTQRGRELARHYMNPVEHLKDQEQSLRLTKDEMEALGKIERASQRIGMNLQSSTINIPDVETYLNLLSYLQKTDLKRIANYIDNIRMDAFSDLMPYIKKANPRASM
ncbi:MAG: hypothetical protein RIT05_1413 [Bacteroidota bacterium]|jgi:hypothetical protein